jgi:hypothetical protein
VILRHAGTDGTVAACWQPCAKPLLSLPYDSEGFHEKFTEYQARKSCASTALVNSQLQERLTTQKLNDQCGSGAISAAD